MNPSTPGPAPVSRPPGLFELTNLGKRHKFQPCHYPFWHSKNVRVRVGSSIRSPNPDLLNKARKKSGQNVWNLLGLEMLLTLQFVWAGPSSSFWGSSLPCHNQPTFSLDPGTRWLGPNSSSFLFFLSLSFSLGWKGAGYKKCRKYVNYVCILWREEKRRHLQLLERVFHYGL